MDASMIVDLQQRYIVLFTLAIYAIASLVLSKDLKFKRLSTAVLAVWFKLLSVVYLINFPLILYFFTLPGADFDSLIRIFLYAYTASYFVMLLVGNLFTLEAFAKIIYIMSGYDVTKQMGLKKIVLKK